MIRLMIVAAALFAAGAHAAETTTLADLQRAPRYPAWATPLAFAGSDDRPWMPFNESGGSADGMRNSTRRLRHLVETQKTSINGPFWTLQLGRHLADLDEDAAAWQVLGDVLAYPPGTPAANAKAGKLADLAAVQREARFLRVRILARRGLRAEATQELQALAPASSYEQLRQAEALALLGEDKDLPALLRRANGGNHPDQGFSDVLLRMRAAALARALGQDALVREIAKPVVAQAMTAQKWPQWQSSWSVLKALDTQAAGAPGGQALRDGEFTGSCRGFEGPIDLQVRIAAGKIAAVTVKQEHESRAWSALEVVPKRIVRRQGLAVDGVTGATVTSCAILAAADQALAKSAEKKPSAP
jgi:uncharacterized protein with FMN-binding domain